VQEVVDNGPNMPLDAPHYSIIKKQQEPFEHLKDQPAGAGLYYSFLYNVVNKLKPKNIVELGNREGSSTISIAAGMDESQTLYTVGIKKNLHRVPPFVLEQDNIHTIFGSSIDPGVVNSLPDNIDFLFIDTLHEYSHLKLEWVYYQKKLSDGAIVACDDINWTGMEKFIDDIKHYDHINEPKLHGSGFLVFQYVKGL